MSLHDDQQQNKSPSLWPAITPYFYSGLNHDAMKEQDKVQFVKTAKNLFANTPQIDQEVAQKSVFMLLQHQHEYDIDVTDILYFTTRYQIETMVQFDDNFMPIAGLDAADQKTVDALFDAYPSWARHLIDMEQIQMDHHQNTLDFSNYSRKQKDLYQINFIVRINAGLDELEEKIKTENYDLDTLFSMQDMVEDINGSESDIIQGQLDLATKRLAKLLPPPDEFAEMINDMSDTLAPYFDSNRFLTSSDDDDDADEPLNPEFEAMLDLYYNQNTLENGYSWECITKYIELTNPIYVTPKALCYFMFNDVIDEIFYDDDGYAFKEKDVDPVKPKDNQPPMPEKLSLKEQEAAEDEHDLSFVEYKPAAEALLYTYVPYDKNAVISNENTEDQSKNSNDDDDDYWDDADVALLHQLNNKYDFVDMHYSIEDIRMYYKNAPDIDDVPPEFDPEALEVLRLQRFVQVSSRKTMALDKTPQPDELRSWIHALTQLGPSNNATLHTEMTELQDQILEMLPQKKPGKSPKATKESKYPFKNRNNFDF